MTRFIVGILAAMLLSVPALAQAPLVQPLPVEQTQHFRSGKRVFNVGAGLGLAGAGLFTAGFLRLYTNEYEDDSDARSFEGFGMALVGSGLVLGSVPFLSAGAVKTHHALTQGGYQHTGLPGYLSLGALGGSVTCWYLALRIERVTIRRPLVRTGFVLVGTSVFLAITQRILDWDALRQSRLQGVSVLPAMVERSPGLVVSARY